MKKILLVLVLSGALFTLTYADTISLKNGRTINGIIKSEEGNTIVLEVSAGSITFLKSEVVNISKSSQQDISDLRQEWSDEKKQLEDRLAQQVKEEESKPKEIGFSDKTQGIILDVLLDKKVGAKMVLDTGASVMLITRNIANRLGFKLDNMKADMMVQVADGRKVRAKRVVIDRVEVQGAEARKVEAAVLLDEVKSFGFGDGLLGMSFLNKFNFKVDQKENKLILEKI